MRIQIVGFGTNNSSGADCAPNALGTRLVTFKLDVVALVVVAARSSVQGGLRLRSGRSLPTGRGVWPDPVISLYKLARVGRTSSRILRPDRKRGPHRVGRTTFRFLIFPSKWPWFWIEVFTDRRNQGSPRRCAPIPRIFPLRSSWAYEPPNSVSGPAPRVSNRAIPSVIDIQTIPNAETG